MSGLKPDFSNVLYNPSKVKLEDSSDSESNSSNESNYETTDFGAENTIKEQAAKITEQEETIANAEAEQMKLTTNLAAAMSQIEKHSTAIKEQQAA